MTKELIQIVNTLSKCLLQIDRPIVAEDLNAQYQNSSLDMPMNEATYLNYLAN